MSSFSQVYVRGYVRKDGTYVAPYVRSSPDGNPYNNYSYSGNTNPYTGKTATGNPDTYVERYYSRSKTNTAIYLKQPEIFNAPVSDKKLYYRGDGSTPILYIIKTDVGQVMCQYKIYNMQNEYIGRLSIFSDGSLYIFDVNNHELSDLPIN